MAAKTCQALNRNSELIGSLFSFNWIHRKECGILEDVSIKRFLQSPWTALGILLLGDLLMMANVLPRQFAFLLAALAIIFVLKAPLISVITFTVAHIPFSPALPVPGFDSLALWRLVVIALLLRLLWQHREALKNKISFRAILGSLKPEDYIALAFFGWATLSLLVATDLVAGLRKLVFLANAAALYAALRWIFPRVQGARAAALIGFGTGVIGLLIFGVAQFIVIEFVSLYDFWQGWSLDIIPVFYGEALGQTLNISNTWFAYYPPPILPTLRMFSLLPDSHSFGITMLIGFLLSLAAVPLMKQKKHTLAAWAAAIAFGVAIFVNGSRGIWVAALPTALIAAVMLFWLLRRGRSMAAYSARTFFLGFLLLTLLFPVSSYISARANGFGVDNAQLDSAFLRARSILDFDELSNRGRIGIWIQNAKSVVAHPLLGVGIGNTAIALNENISAARRGASAHNLYLDFAVETGVVGGSLVLLWFMTIFMRSAFMLFRNKVPENLYGLTMVLLLATVWISIYNLVDIVFINDRALLAYFVLLAAVVSSETPKNKVQAAVT